MTCKTLKFTTAAIFSLLTAVSFAQDEIGTEVINVVRPYTPTVSDAFKIKETPSLSDSVTMKKKEVDYSIFSVPVASTFTPAKGKATGLERTEKEKLYDNYASLGFGNYTSVLGEFYSNFQLSRTDNAGFFFKHNSSQGGIEGVVLDDKFYDTSLDANYTSFQKDMSYRIGVNALHQLYNWYGINTSLFNTPEEITSIDPQHSFMGAGISGNVKFEESLFSEADVRLQYFGDSFDSAELNTAFEGKFKFDIAGQNVGLDAEVDYLNGSFERTYFFSAAGINYSYLSTSLSPSILLQDSDFTLKLGAKLTYLMDMEESESDFFIYPQIQASYRLVDEFLTVYAGAEGDLRQNTYKSIAQENPYVSPTLFIAPTDQAIDGYAGIKGKLSNSVSYNFRGSYMIENNKALFVKNPFKGTNPEFEGYENGNSFGLAYGDLNTLEFFGELQVSVSKDFSMGLNAQYFSYSTDIHVTDIPDEAYNLPDLKASLFANINFSEKVYGGIDLYFVGERKALFENTDATPAYRQIITLDPYFDANAHVGYRINEQLSVFGKASNIAGDTYQKWLNYPTLGLQVLAGATYKFDW